jgi:hypothetical protein
VSSAAVSADTLHSCEPFTGSHVFLAAFRVGKVAAKMAVRGSGQIARPLGAARAVGETNDLPRFPKGGLWLPKGRQKVRLR